MSGKKIKCNYDFENNAPINLVIESLATDPSTNGLVEGRIWYNSTDKVMKYWNGTNIITLGS